MDPSIASGFIAIVGVIVGAVGTYIYQSRLLKQQREWSLDDQKRQWKRDGLIELLASLEAFYSLYLKFGYFMSGEMDSETSKEIIEELSTSIGKIDVSVDDELRRLFVEDYLPLTGDPSEDMSSEDVSMSFTAHLNMKKRINELLEDTYN